MLVEYIEQAMSKAKYERMKDQEPYYGEILACKGVWAKGKTLAECKEHLRQVLEDWLFVRIRKGLSIPSMNGKSIRPLVKVQYDKAQAGQTSKIHCLGI
ncbi:MAG: type II toxin-antitoxin system HicB family antitoxin [Nanoarchaeota archaeon]